MVIKMKLTEQIAMSILEMMREENGIAEIQRNELAGKIGCVPSQINYVITSRFTPEQGYTVESKRGGGGYIRISRIDAPMSGFIMHLVNAMGDCMDEGSCRAILLNLRADGILNDKMASLIFAAVSNKTLRNVPKDFKDLVRCDLMKQLLLSAI